MANMLVETLAGDFDAAEFEDDYAEAVEALVKAKIEGGEVKRTETSTKSSGEVVDLLAALQRSRRRRQDRPGRGRADASEARARSRPPRSDREEGPGQEGRGEEVDRQEGRRQEGELVADSPLCTRESRYCTRESAPTSFSTDLCRESAHKRWFRAVHKLRLSGSISRPVASRTR